REEEPTHALGARGGEDRPRPLHVDALELGVGGLVAVERGEVNDRVATAEHVFEAVTVEKVDALLAHLGSLCAQLARDMAPDEAGRACHIDEQARAALRRAAAVTG